MHYVVVQSVGHNTNPSTAPGINIFMTNFKGIGDFNGISGSHYYMSLLFLIFHRRCWLSG